MAAAPAATPLFSVPPQGLGQQLVVLRHYGGSNRAGSIYKEKRPQSFRMEVAAETQRAATAAAVDPS